tara:strand:+ start:42 stop:614 length:573 start_codon:yes stop_codon:yes gene_type:complete
MSRYCFGDGCNKKCAKNEYKLETKEVVVCKNDLPSVCYINMKSYEETPEFYTMEKKRNSYCLDCYDKRNPPVVKKITKEEKEMFPIFKSKEELDKEKDLQLDELQQKIEELRKEYKRLDERNKKYENEWSCVDNILCNLEEYTTSLEKLNTNDPFHYHTDDEWCRNKNIVKRMVELTDKYKSIEFVSNPV